MTEESPKPKRTRKQNHTRAKEVVEDQTLIDKALPKLTAYQEAFVKNILAGLTAAESYKRAYPDCNLSGNSLYVDAHRALHSPKVQMWIAAAKRMSLMDGTVTFDRWLSDQHALIQEARENKAFSTAQEGHKTLGKALGFIDKQHDANTMLSAENLMLGLGKILPPIIGHDLWKQVEHKLALALLGVETTEMKIIEHVSEE